jgi:hypothetical protein
MQEISSNGDLPSDICQWATRRTMFLAAVLTAGLLSFYLRISYRTLTLVLALGQLHAHGFDSPRYYVREYHLLQR